MPIHKVRALRMLEFSTLYPPVYLDTLLMTPFPTMCSTLSSIPQCLKKTLKKLLRFISHLWKRLLLNFLFSDSHVTADNPGGQCVKDNVGVKHIFEHLLGHFFSPWLKLKQSSKRFCNRHFSKYLANNSRTHSNHHKNYAKTVLH